MQGLTLTQRTIVAGQASLAGKRRGLRAYLPFVGPAVIDHVPQAGDHLVVQ